MHAVVAREIRGYSVLAWLALGGGLWAGDAASLKGRVEDASGAACAGARVVLRIPGAGFERQVTTGTDGAFAFDGLPAGEAVLEATKPGFTERSRAVTLRASASAEAVLRLAIQDVRGNVSVTAFETAARVDPEATGTRAQLDRSEIERLPVPAGTRALESVLLSFPGFAADANGAIHPRGAHNQMTYVIDGMPIGDQLTGAFGNGIDSVIVQTIELYTGNIPAEYGAKVSGVANITTRSGLGTGRSWFGSLDMGAAAFDQLSSTAQAGGHAGRFGWFASASVQRSHRFLDQVSLDNLHNGGNAGRGFARFDWQSGTADFLRLNIMAGRSSFELANLRSQHAAGQDQRQALRDAAVSAGYIHVIGAAATFEAVYSYRSSIAQLFPSAGDTPVTAAQARHLSNLTLAHRVNLIRGRHDLRTGFDWQHFPVSENFQFAITSPGFNAPGAEGYIPTLTAFDLSRGGRWFEFADRRSGNLHSAFVQDKIKAGPLLMNLGLRYDRYALLVSGGQWQPRTGAVLRVPRTGTLLRASYNRLYQTPVNENLLLSNSPRSAVLVPPEVRATLGGALIRIPPEIDNVYEAGFQQPLGSHLAASGVYYRKQIRNLHDNDNFFNTGVIFPTALARARVRGAEGRLVLSEWRRLAGTLSLTHYSVVAEPPFTGGLFLGSTALDVLGSGPFVMDHDQKLAIHGVVTVRPRADLWASVSARHDSGLVTNPSDPQTVAADPDYADLLPYVNLEARPPRVRPRTIVDLAAGWERTREGRRRWEAVVHAANLTGRTALYNFQSIFVGTRLVQPRTFGLRLRWYW